MGGFNLLEAACWRLLPAGQQLLMWEKDKMHLELMFIQPQYQLVMEAGAFLFIPPFID